MKTIRMTKGMVTVGGTVHTAGGKPFAIEDERAARLTVLGVAVYAKEEAENEGSEQDGIEEMTYAELKERAAELGIKTAGVKKADLVASIKAAETKAEGDGEEAPTFDATESVK